MPVAAEPGGQPDDPGLGFYWANVHAACRLAAALGPIRAVRHVKKLQRWLANAGPATTTLFGWYYSWQAGFARNVIVVAAFLVVASIYAAIALYKRSKGEEAVIVTTRIMADTDESPDDPVDYVGSLDFLFGELAVLICLLAAGLPPLKAQ